MEADRRRRRNAIIALVVLAPLLILAAWALSFAGSAGMLPWQPEPTRIPITPFADLMGEAVTPAP
ncbi:MAG: hypothetical protein IT338_16750 [Thermomicrobiales bacterium]|nr:hypothetical protein [Thermomicrobiales bacterium]